MDENLQKLDYEEGVSKNCNYSRKTCDLLVLLLAILIVLLAGICGYFAPDRLIEKKCFTLSSNDGNINNKTMKINELTKTNRFVIFSIRLKRRKDGEVSKSGSKLHYEIAGANRTIFGEMNVFNFKKKSFDTQTFWSKVFALTENTKEIKFSYNLSTTEPVMFIHVNCYVFNNLFRKYEILTSSVFAVTMMLVLVVNIVFAYKSGFKNASIEMIMSFIYLVLAFFEVLLPLVDLYLDNYENIVLYKKIASSFNTGFFMFMIYVSAQHISKQISCQTFVISIKVGIINTAYMLYSTFVAKSFIKFAPSLLVPVLFSVITIVFIKKTTNTAVAESEIKAFHVIGMTIIFYIATSASMIIKFIPAFDTKSTFFMLSYAIPFAFSIVNVFVNTPLGTNVINAYMTSDLNNAVAPETIGFDEE